MAERIYLDLECPFCGSAYIHHRLVDMFTRQQEDSSTTRTSVNQEGLVSQQESDYNPSDRRDAVRVRFECEGDHVFYLYLVQHKGMSFLFAEEDEAAKL